MGDFGRVVGIGEQRRAGPDAFARGTFSLGAEGSAGPLHLGDSPPRWGRPVGGPEGSGWRETRARGSRSCYPALLRL